MERTNAAWKRLKTNLQKLQEANRDLKATRNVARDIQRRLIGDASWRLVFGSTRTVLLTRDRAFKFPTFYSYRLFLHGLLANMQEATFHKTGHRKLCPVLFHLPFGFLIVMARLRPLTEEEWEKLDYEAFVNEVDMHIPVENKRDSFGTYLGVIFALDYG